MPEFLSSDPLLRGLILTLPFLALLVLLFIRRAKRKHGVRQESAAPAGETKTIEQLLKVPAAASDAKAADNALAVLQRLVKDAESKGDGFAAAGLHLEIAELCAANGDEKLALSAWRSAAAVSSKHGPAAVHGTARIALAEAAYRAGDLTTACEQWQMARLTFQQNGPSGKAEEIDKRMRANGCPTDWVLTDF